LGTELSRAEANALGISPVMRRRWLLSPVGQAFLSKFFAFWHTMKDIEIQQMDLSAGCYNKIYRLYITSVGLIFILTGLTKIVSSLGHAQVLSLNDPIFRITFRHLMLFVGLLELSVSAILLYVPTVSRNCKLGLILWMAINFITYRYGLWWIKWNSPCSCLGNLTDAVGMTAKTADIIMRSVIAYLLVGALLTMAIGKISGRTSSKS
jgi:hypothetical protein